MKSLENVKEYLKVKGMNDKDIHKVIGFLYAEGDFVLGTPLNYKKNENCFANFVKWYEDENGYCEKIDEYGDNIIDGWIKLRNIVISRGDKINAFNIDLKEVGDAIEDVHRCADNILENANKLRAVLESLEEEENEEE